MSPQSKKIMDTKQLIEKFVKGEITEEELEQEKAKLNTEDLKTFDDQKTEAQKAAAKKELEEIQNDLKRARLAKKGIETDDGIAGKLREENLASAKEQFYSQMGLKDEDIKSFEEGFKSESVTIENIQKDMKKHYAFTHSDDFFKLADEKKQREIEADEFNAQNGGTGGSGGGGEEMKKVSKEVQEYIKASEKLGFNVTPEQAERALAIKKNGGHIQ